MCLNTGERYQLFYIKPVYFFDENPERMTKLLKIKNDISLVSIVPHFLVILDNNPTYETLNPLDLSLKNLQNLFSNNGKHQHILTPSFYIKSRCYC